MAWLAFWIDELLVCAQNETYYFSVSLIIPLLCLLIFLMACDLYWLPSEDKHLLNSIP